MNAAGRLCGVTKEGVAPNGCVTRHYYHNNQQPLAYPALLQVNAAGRLCGVTKDGGAGIDPSTTAAMVEVAKRAAPPVITRIQKYIAAQTAKAAAA